MADFKANSRIASKIKENEEYGRYRTLLRRVGSGFIDFSILCLFLIPIMYLMSIFDFKGKYIILNTISVAVFLIYNIIAILVWEKTIGKKIFGIVIKTKDDEARVKAKHAIRRELINIVNLVVLVGFIFYFISNNLLEKSDLIAKSKFDNQAYSSYMIISLFLSYAEIITAAINKKRRAIHDFIGQTIVIKLEKVNATVAVVGTIIGIGVMFLYFRVYALLNLSN